MYTNLKMIKPKLKIGGSIAIVGSSANLKRNNFSQEIDKHDEVIRFNRAPVKGFEEYVGNITTLRVVNNHVFDNIDITNKGFSNQPKNFVKDLRNEKILYIGPDINPWKRRKSNTHNSNRLYLFDYSKISNLKEIFGIKNQNNLQIGTIVISLCILSGLKPKLYGFDLEPIPRTHYFEDRPSNIKDSMHTIEQEMQLLVNFKEKGLILTS